jgi:uncharacterized tellurite resistance protein B-like protein
MLTFQTFEELAAYLLLYVARVDGNIHYLEEATLKELLGGLTKDDTKLHLAQATFLANSNVKIEQLLRDNQALIQQEPKDRRQQLIEALFAVVNSDGRVQEEETGALRIIRGALAFS